MIKCEECGREFKNIIGLGTHVASKHMSVKDYYLKYIGNEGKCVTCGKPTTFINMNIGYLRYCSQFCVSNNEDIKNKKIKTNLKNYNTEYAFQSEVVKNKISITNLKRFGCKNPMQNEEIKNKGRETCLKNHGFIYPMQNEEIKNKYRETCLKNHGFTHPMQNEEIKNKGQETCLKNHGVRIPYKSEEIRNKGKETCLKNHGVEYAYQSEEIKNKGKVTCLKNHGVSYPYQNEEIRNKGKETCLKNHGVRNPYKSEEIRNKGKETCLKNYGVENPSHSEEIVKKIKLSFKRCIKRYPDVVKIENLIEGPNGEILGHCKNSNCHNSEENGDRFILTASQIQYRNIGINLTPDGHYFYCCEECKHECILYGKSAVQLDNIINPLDNLNKASDQELYIWRLEVFIRQLKDNPDHQENFCEICHKTENLVGHHEMPQKLYPEFALDPDNGIVLCSKCHNKFGHEKGSHCSTGNLANKICK
jgi:5-methylcytosine-specific restriction endonuclease McrA